MNIEALRALDMDSHTHKRTLAPIRDKLVKLLDSPKFVKATHNDVEFDVVVVDFVHLTRAYRGRTLLANFCAMIKHQLHQGTNRDRVLEMVDGLGCVLAYLTPHAIPDKMVDTIRDYVKLYKYDT